MEYHNPRFDPSPPMSVREVVWVIISVIVLPVALLMLIGTALWNFIKRK